MRKIYQIMPSPIQRQLKKLRQAWQSEPFLNAIGLLLFESQMLITMFLGRQSLRKVSIQKNLRLHLGCGSDIRPDWINIDMVKSHNIRIPENAMFVTYDLRRNIPLQDESCSYIYSSHFWEHLDYFTGFKMMQESYRVLAKDGIFRIVLPDFEKVFKAYAANDVQFFEGIPEQSLENIQGTETLLDYVHYTVYQYGEHKCLYDLERISKMLIQAGFKDVRQVEFDASVDIDEPLRTRYSFYIEATP